MTFPETAARMPLLGLRSPERSVSSHGVAVAAAGTGSLLQRTQWLALADPAWLRCAGRWRLPACLRRDARAHRVLRQRGPAGGTAGHPSHGGEGQPCQQPPRCGAGSGPAAAAEPVSIAVARAASSALLASHLHPCTRVHTCTHSPACSCTRARDRPCLGCVARSPAFSSVERMHQTPLSPRSASYPLRTIVTLAISAAVALVLHCGAPRPSYLNGNNITALGPAAFAGMPLLEHLNLGSNRVCACLLVCLLACFADLLHACMHACMHDCA